MQQRFFDFFANLTKSDFLVSVILQFILLFVLFCAVFILLKNNKNGRLIWIFTVYLLACGVALCLVHIDAGIRLVVVIVMSMFIFMMYHTEIKRSMLDANINRNAKRGQRLSVSNVEAITDEMTQAILNMSKNNIGALIVLSDGNLPEGIIESGTVVNADITSSLVQTVFYPKTPLHDGAMIIEGNKVMAAGCFLPLLQNENLPKELGSRHRAALGVTSVASVTVIVVSEETGIISIVKNGEVKKRFADAGDIKNVFTDFYWEDLTAHEGGKA